MVLKKITKFCVFLFVFQSSLRFYAQKTRVIDNKGTLKTIGNNRVFTTIDDNTLVTSTLSSTLSEGDIWYDLNSYTVTVGGSTQTKTRGPIKVYEYVRDNLGEVTSKQWKQISYKGQKGSVFFADDNGNFTERNEQFFWNNTTTNPKLHIGSRGSGNPINPSGSVKLNVYGGAKVTSGIKLNSGSVSLPSYRFNDNVRTGMFLSNNTVSTIALGFTVSSTNVVEMYNGVTSFSNYTNSPTINLGVDIKGRLRIGNIPEDNNGRILMVKNNGLVVQTSISALGSSTVTPTDVGGGMKTRTIAIHKAGGTTATTSINETVTALTQENGNTATATVSVTLPEGQTTTQTTKTIATYQNEETTTITINETVTNIAQTLSNTTSTSQTFTFVTGTTTITAITTTNTTKPIATYINENTKTITINETVTSLIQDTNTSTITAGNIFYTNEAGKTHSATVVSKNIDNDIKVGTDGGAYLSINNFVHVGHFVIDYDNTGTNSFTISVDDLPFKPSKVTFVAHANVGDENIDDDNNYPYNNSNNVFGVWNSFGSMNGYATEIINTSNTPPTVSIKQQVIYIGGSANSINDISRYASNTHCIGIRFSEQNGGDIGKIRAKLTSFFGTSTTPKGFRIQVNYDDGEVDNSSSQSGHRMILPNDIEYMNILVMYTAYR